MPHAQVIGPCKVEDLAGPLSRLIETTPPLVLKVLDSYLGHGERRLILESLVVEGYLHQGFFLLIRQDEGGVLIRCHPNSHVQKTDGVRRLIALVARKCIELCPGSRLGNTNLTPYLKDLAQEEPEREL